MKILVCGGRDYDDKVKIWQTLDRIVWGECRPPYIVVHGAAPGADTAAGQWARARRWSELPYPARWDVHGSAAGPIRNKQMLDENPDIALVVAFPGGKGTANMVKQARKRGFRVMEVPS